MGDVGREKGGCAGPSGPAVRRPPRQRRGRGTNRTSPRIAAMFREEAAAFERSCVPGDEDIWAPAGGPAERVTAAQGPRDGGWTPYPDRGSILFPMEGRRPSTAPVVHSNEAEDAVVMWQDIDDESAAALEKKGFRLGRPRRRRRPPQRYSPLVCRWISYSHKVVN